MSKAHKAKFKIKDRAKNILSVEVDFNNLIDLKEALRAMAVKLEKDFSAKPLVKLKSKRKK